MKTLFVGAIGAAIVVSGMLVARVDLTSPSMIGFNDAAAYHMHGHVGQTRRVARRTARRTAHRHY